jgi:hypothetical protein
MTSSAQRRFLSTNSPANSAFEGEPGVADERKPHISFEQIWRNFETVELSEQLSDWAIGGVYIWPLLRDRLMREVAENLGVFQRRIEAPRRAVPQISSFSVTRSKYAVVPFLRRDAAGVDQFSQPIIDELLNSGIEPLVIGVGDFDAARLAAGSSSATASASPTSSASSSSSTSPTLHIDQLEALFLRRHRPAAKRALAWVLIPQLGGARHFAKYQRVVAALEASFGAGATGQFQTFPRWLIVDFWAQREGWKRFFTAAGVRKVFVVNAWKRALIAGAQASGAWVVEPQHGVLSDKHPLLSWPATSSVSYLPNEVYVWGEFWARETGLPNSIKKTIIGAPQALTRLSRTAAEAPAAAAPAAESRADVLFVSQAQQTTRLFDIAIRAAEANPGRKFKIKPHPQESISQFESHLAGRSLPANLAILDVPESALELMSTFEFVVGVHSMALIEAIKLGAKVIVVQLEGWQYIEAIAKRGDVTLAPPTTDLVAELASSRVSKDPDYYFAPPLEASAFESLLLQERP